MAGNNLLAAKILRDSNTTKGGTNALAEQFPELYGAIKGLLGTAPDEVGGSVLDGSHQAQKAGAGYGFPIGLLAQMLPLAKVTKGMPVGMSIKAVDDAKFVYPQEKALLTAQRNAALPVEQGGLGLHPNNTPMERAQAMGFDTPQFHVSRHGVDVTELDSGKYAMAPFDAVGTHVGTEKAALDRFNNTVGTTDQIKGSTYPVMIRKGDQYIPQDASGVWAEDALNNALLERGGYATARETYPSLNAKLRKDLFKSSGYDSIPYINDVESAGQVSHIVPPWNIRSRFAAFDPFRRNEPDLLAGALPFSALADEDNRNQLRGLLGY